MALSSRQSPRSRLRSGASSSRPLSGDSGVASGGSLSHRQQQQQPPPQPQSDLELLADSERQICRLLSNQNSASRASLNLSYRRLTILPPSLTSLGSDLKRLYLNNNRLVAPPSEIGNCLSELQLTSLPDRLFDGMSSLKQLGLNYNRLDRLPDSIGRCVSLEWLSAEENLLADLPDSLAHCRRLNLVNLTANRFQQLPVQLLSLLSQSGRCLRHLLLRANPLRSDCLTDDILMQIMAPIDAAPAAAVAADSGDSDSDEAADKSANAPRIDLRGAADLVSLPEHWKGFTSILVGPEDSDETETDRH